MSTIKSIYNLKKFTRWPPRRAYGDGTLERGAVLTTQPTYPTYRTSETERIHEVHNTLHQCGHLAAKIGACCRNNLLVVLNWTETTRASALSLRCTCSSWLIMCNKITHPLLSELKGQSSIIYDLIDLLPLQDMSNVQALPNWPCFGAEIIVQVVNLTRCQISDGPKIGRKGIQGPFRGSFRLSEMATETRYVHENLNFLIVYWTTELRLTPSKLNDLLGCD